MALINCDECNQEISDKAASCPKCGIPIASAQETIAAGTRITTIQETSKKFKIQTIISVSFIIVGAVWLIGESSGSSSEATGVPGLLTFAGLVWYIINRFRIWWHHK